MRRASAMLRRASRISATARASGVARDLRKHCSYGAYGEIEWNMIVTRNGDVFDKATLRNESRLELDRWVKMLKENPAVSLEIDGHADSTGPEPYNQKLSERRANSVKSWLIDNGIPASRLSATGYGETSPKYDNATREGRKLNRRVELQSK